MNPSSLFRGTVSPGSACLVAAVPEEWIDILPDANPVTGIIESDIVLKDDYKWLQVVLVSKTRPFKEENERSDAGQAWSQSISGRSCGHSAGLHILLERWSQYRWVLIYKEVGTDATYLVGRPGSGALMNVQYSNEKATVSSISFTRQSVRRAHIYNGSYTLDNSVTISNSTDVKVTFYDATGAEGSSFSPATDLSGNTILWVDRNGLTTMQPVTAAPSDRRQIQVAGNVFTVISTEPLQADEKIAIVYK